MIFRTIIIEDEQLARERLKKILTKHEQNIQIIAEAENGYKALELINKLNPDLIFLDIQMPGMNGFEVLEKIEKLPIIIFTTAYDEYALQAFETNSIDYLLKPISPERLNQAISKLNQFYQKNEQFNENILKMLNNLTHPKKDLFQVKVGAKILFIKHKDIYFFKAEEKYIFLYTYDKKYILNTSLNELEIDLPQNFVRTHRSSFVNLDHIQEILKLSMNKYIVIMNDKIKTELPLSRKAKSKLVK